MKVINYLMVIIIGFFSFNFGCIAYKKDIKFDASPDKINECARPRDCTIDVKLSFTNLAEYDLYKNYQGNQSGIYSCFPLLILYFWKTSGPVFSSHKEIDENINSNLQQLITDTIDRSKICSNTGKRYILKAKVLHLYGVNYSKKFYGATIGAYSGNYYNFFPTGFVSIKLMLIDPETEKILATNVISNTFLYNPGHPKFMYNSASGSSPNFDMESLRLDVACISLSQLMEELPLAVDQMLSNEKGLAVTSGEKFENFTIARMTKEYNFAEEVVVEYRTGKIISDNIVRRTYPVTSSPDEWFILPVQDGHWMEPDRYKKFISKLKGKYDVSFGDNLNVATYNSFKK
jgi:hypothetical protein